MLPGRFSFVFRRTGEGAFSNDRADQLLSGRRS
jgi:hypothetical protein